VKNLSQPNPPTTPVWVWPNLIGLDAPIVAVCWQAMFAKIAGVDLPWLIHLILGLSTWCIYLGDRMVDVARNPQPTSTSRHRFTQLHIRKLIPLLIIVSACNLILIIKYLPQNLLISGCITLVLVAIYYLIRLTRLKNIITIVPREVMCGMLFALGCAIAPHAYSTIPWSHTPSLIIPIITFGIVCSASCILISIWEKEADGAAGDSSIITTHSNFIPYIATSLTCLAVISVTLAYFFYWQPFLAVALSAILLRLTLRYEDRISPIHLRVLADTVLITPLLFVWF
jgi:hypothetical protein